VPPRERGKTPAGFRTQLLQRPRNEALHDGIPAQRRHVCSATRASPINLRHADYNALVSTQWFKGEARHGCF
jgi:hypothetical protein